MAKNNRTYLMKRRRYGWGWTPVTWIATLIVSMQIAIIFIAATLLPAKPVQPTAGELIAFLAIFALAVMTIILFGLASSPKPTWRWGKEPSDNPDEDF
ncbi:MAG: hypothetical protein JWP06_266 [Candidatus Saccharibacteria bacterium]|nr:hypothetical protein [Candidatus Saccharibacteria bacterium]